MKRTKFFVATLFTSLFACLCMLFSGCQLALLSLNGSENTSDNISENMSGNISEDTVAGVYKTKSVTITQGETTKELHLGETEDGVTLTEDWMELVLTENGYGVIIYKPSGYSSKCTWAQSEEDKIVIYEKHSDEWVFEYNGSTITQQIANGDYSEKWVLEKKRLFLTAAQAQVVGYYQYKSVTSSSGETIDMSEEDESIILAEDGCAYFLEEFNLLFVGTWTQTKNGKLSLTARGDTFIGECDGTKVTFSVEGKTYVMEK